MLQKNIPIWERPEFIAAAKSHGEMMNRHFRERDAHHNDFNRTFGFPDQCPPRLSPFSAKPSDDHRVKAIGSPCVDRSVRYYELRRYW